MNPRILIGPCNDKGSISTINKEFIIGLGSKYSFIPFNVKRNYYNNQLSKFNIINILYFFLQYAKWIFVLIKNKPRLVHYTITSNWNFEKSLIFLVTAKFCGAKAIGHLHGGAFDTFWLNSSRFRKRIALSLIKKIDAIIVSGEYWKIFLINNVSDKIYISVVNNPINSSFVNALQKENDYLNKNGFDIFFIGSIGKRKGVYDIIESLRWINNNIKLSIIGVEDCKGDLESVFQLINKYNLNEKININISAKLDLEDKVEIFSNSKIFLLPSYNENFPLSVIEAACAGLPIITTSVGALPEFFTHMENIYFVEAGNIEQIKDAIVYLIDNVNERERLGRGARKVFMEKLLHDQIIKQLDPVYKNLL